MLGSEEARVMCNVTLAGPSAPIEGSTTNLHVSNELQRAAAEIIGF